MKKIIFILLSICLLHVTSRAQSSEDSIKAKATLTNAQSDTASVTISGPKATVTFQTNIVKTSGTIAGTIKLYGSIDGGSSWFLISTDTLTDASAVYAHTYAYNPYHKYRIVTATTGTSVCTTQSWVLYRQ